MGNLKVEAQLSYEQLLRAVEQLSLSELEKVGAYIISLQAQRKAPSLSSDQARLLITINQGVPADIQNRYDELIQKRRMEMLTPGQYSELLALSDQVETIEAKRVEAMAELARLPQISLST
ncbi:STAS/SEC14 domain-containing protein [Moorena producens PAL-8-15-08-1]|uniref:STAS/SEC14 domain-containing protein n=1 Tax=Moorena producens PAL-8-15-08-1 TaxID=1458985 RepID=A0A1D8U0M7_9CYAN|nr:STAS/SEC14 domain-containing protein [Moorena producens]AOX03461.1 STAS/SEC14 domain-containing protein [Moorena producens PAL-8-15-08-1]